MRYTRDALKESKFDKDFIDYILDYVDEIEDLGATFQSVEISESTQDVETHVFYFEIDEKFVLDEEILTRDDDSQPHNSYRIYFGSLMIYETRFV